MAGAGNVRAGGAFVELFTVDGPLRKGLDDAAKRVAAFGKGVALVGAGIGGLGAAVLTPLVAASKVFADMGSELFDMSKRTGIAVDDLSTLKFAADQAGSSIGDVAIAIRAMQQTLAKADDDGKKAVETLNNLGLSLDALQGLSPADQFRMLAKAISAIPDEAKRTAAAMAVFKKAGTNLKGMLQELAESEEKARRLGLVVTPEQAEAADALGDAMGALWDQTKMVTFSVGAALAPALTDLLGVLSQGLRVVIDFAKENQALIGTVAKFAAGAVILGGALYGVGTAISVVSSLGLVNTAVWVAWNIAATAATVVIGVFNTQLAIWNALLSGGAVASAVWSAAVTVAQVATWAWNAALTVMNALLAPAALLAAAGTVVILGTAFIVVAGAVWGVVNAATAVFAILSKIPTATGPLKAVSAVLGEWVGILNDVWRAATVKLPLAWEFMQAGFSLAVAQVRDLFPPLWQFIQKGFTAIAEAVSDIFVSSFFQAINRILGEILKSIGPFAELFGIDIGQIEEQQRFVDETARKVRKTALEKAKRDVEKAIGEFKVGDESDEVKKARAELDRLRKELAAVEKAAVVVPDIPDIGAAQKKVESVGTFSSFAAAAGGLGAKSINEKMLVQLEKIAEKETRIAALLAELNLGLI